MQDVRRATYLLNLLLAGALVASIAWKPAPAPAFAGVRAAQVPSRVAGLESAGENEVGEEIRKALATSTLIARTYQNSAGDLVDFILIGGTDREALHDPRSCLIGADWRILNDHSEPLPGTNVTARSCRIERPGEAYDVLYFYVADGQIIHEATQIRLQMLGSALLGRPGRPTYFLRFLQPAHLDHAHLQGFAAGMWTALQEPLQGSPIAKKRSSG